MLDFLKPFASFSYWFAQYSEPFAGGGYWGAVGTIGGAIVLGIVVRMVSFFIRETTWRKTLRRLAALAMTMGALAFISFFFTQISAPVLGSRFWFLLWVIVAAVWLFSILKYVIRVAPKERATRAQAQEYQKYLPRSGK